jgi:hypothetical protein
MPSSSAASSTVPQRRQITAPQSPQVSGSGTSAAHLGQYSGSELGIGSADIGNQIITSDGDAQMERRSPDIPYVLRARIEACPHRRKNSRWPGMPVFIEG